MRNLSIPYVPILLALASVSIPAQPPPDPFKVMITEVSWNEPDGLELTNFGASSADLRAWRVLWKDATGTTSSAPLNAVLAPNASLVVLEQNPAPVPETLPGVQVLALLPRPAVSDHGRASRGAAARRSPARTPARRPCASLP